MKLVIEHKLDDDQQDMLKGELEEALAELKTQIDKTFSEWESTKRAARASILTVSVFFFSLGYFVGKSR